MTVSVTVVGLGQIGAGYDLASDAPPRSHIGAALATPGISVTGLVDADSARILVVKNRWPELRSARAAPALSHLEPGQTDVIVLATPAQDRPELVAQAIALKPKLLLVEKPLALSLDDGRAAVCKADGAGIQLRVNFHRRLDAGHQRVRAAFTNRPVAVIAAYNKGLHNYGSHLIDLLLDWCGPVTGLAALNAHPGGEDPAIGFRLRFHGGVEATAIAVAGTCYDNFDIQFFYENGKVELAAGGVERRVWRAKQDMHYRGYSHLALDASASESSPVAGLPELYAAARDYLMDGTPLPGCSGPDALAGLVIIDAIKRSAAANFAWQTIMVNQSTQSPGRAE